MRLIDKLKHKEKVVAILEINEEINASSGPYGNKDGTQGILDFLHKFLDISEPLDGLLLRMNTPGGTAGASEEIANLVARLKDERKIPVVVSIADLCCSGGYMIACVADAIYANKGSMTGSIGCILQIPNFSGLSDKLGVRYTTIKSGKMKDLGNPMRDMTAEERIYLDEFAKETHDAFIAHVTKFRPNIKNTEEMFDGRPVGANDALENGLIDGFGGYYDAYDALLFRIGEKTDKNVSVDRFEKKRGLLKRLFGTFAPFSMESVLKQYTESNLSVR